MAVLAIAVLVHRVGTGPAVVVLAGFQLMTLGVAVAAAVEVDRRRRRASDRQDRAIASAVEDLHEALTKQAATLTRALGVTASAEAERAIAELRGSIDERAASSYQDVARAVKDEVQGLRESLHRVEVRLRRAGNVDFEQLEALVALYAEMRPERSIPRTRGWAASPDLLRTCWDLVVHERPELVVECGSGASTVVLASACRRNGRGHVVALDHEERFAQRTRDLLTAHGLEGWADVRTAPLQPLDDGVSWYRLAEVPRGPVDLVLVDGPPAGRDPEARAPTLEVLAPRLSPHATIVVDDYVRDAERATVAGWLERFPDLELEVIKAEKGAAILRRRADGEGLNSPA
ncbi:class I SAM-dependent methyltransferase [Nitriliruptoraceae bacterium ZYF776]|nr:class I SAM-dependent methyltransferase [Profundirhabdus halotolerans]